MTPAEQIAYVRRYFQLMSASDIDGIIALGYPDQDRWEIFVKDDELFFF